VAEECLGMGNARGTSFFLIDEAQSISAHLSRLSVSLDDSKDIAILAGALLRRFPQVKQVMSQTQTQ